MSFLRGLLASRSHIAFLGGFAIALGTIWKITPTKAASASSMTSNFSELVGLDAKTMPASRASAPALDEREKIWATTAWSYFEKNYRPETGLVDSFEGFPSATLWDLGSYLMGLIAAHDLGIVDDGLFDTRIAKLLESLGKLPLVDGTAPNKAYDTRSLAMVNYDNTPAPQGIGWSTLDVARLAVPFQIIAWRFPKHTSAVRHVLGGWKLDAIVEGGRMIGAHRGPSGELLRVQEGRFGYEQYAAKSLFLLGCDVSKSVRYDLDVAVTEVSGQRVAHDARMPKDHDGTHNAVLSEPYVLEALEYGLDATTLPLAAAVYRAQSNRAKATGHLTAVSEDNLDRPPHFAYASVLNDGKAWAAFTPDGKDAAKFRTLSVKAAVGWSYVFGDAYADQLHGAVDSLLAPGRGFYAGRYEADGSPNQALTANTNGIVLEALLYRTRGPLVRAARKSETDGAERKP
jgi:hypothetical protein